MEDVDRRRKDTHISNCMRFRNGQSIIAYRCIWRRRVRYIDPHSISLCPCNRSIRLLAIANMFCWWCRPCRWRLMTLTLLRWSTLPPVPSTTSAADADVHVLPPHFLYSLAHNASSLNVVVVAVYNHRLMQYFTYSAIDTCWHCFFQVNIGTTKN